MRYCRGGGEARARNTNSAALPIYILLCYTIIIIVDKVIDVVGYIYIVNEMRALYCCENERSLVMVKISAQCLIYADDDYDLLVVALIALKKKDS